MMKYPVGFRFHPTDAEIVGHYLHNRATTNGAQFRPTLIADCPDFYGQMEPWVIWERLGGPSLEEGEALYLFTERRKLNPKGRHFNRKVGSGTWSAQHVRDIVEDGCVIGVKREFRYEGGCSSDQNNGWLMQEYEIGEKDSSVVCSLRKKTTSAANVKKRKRNHKSITTSAHSDDPNDPKRLRIEGASVGSNITDYDYDIVPMFSQQNGECSSFEMVDYGQSKNVGCMEQNSRNLIASSSFDEEDFRKCLIAFMNDPVFYDNTNSAGFTQIES